MAMIQSLSCASATRISRLASCMKPACVTSFSPSLLRCSPPASPPVARRAPTHAHAHVWNPLLLFVCARGLHTSHRSYDTPTHGANSCRLFFFAQGRAIRRQMHNYKSLEKSTFMADYIRLHKADMEEEQSNENRKQLAQFLGHDRRASMLATKP
jgi:hypothetical protein